MVFANRGLASRSALARPKPSRELLSRSLKKCGKSQMSGLGFENVLCIHIFPASVLLLLMSRYFFGITMMLLQ